MEWLLADLVKGWQEETWWGEGAAGPFLANLFLDFLLSFLFRGGTTLPALAFLFLAVLPVSYDSFA